MNKYMQEVINEKMKPFEKHPKKENIRAFLTECGERVCAQQEISAEKLKALLDSAIPCEWISNNEVNEELNKLFNQINEHHNPA